MSAIATLRSEMVADPLQMETHSAICHAAAMQERYAEVQTVWKSINLAERYPRQPRIPRQEEEGLFESSLDYLGHGTTPVVSSTIHTVVF